MIYCKIEGGIVVNRAVFDGPMPDGWVAEGDTWVANDEAQIGWSYVGGAMTAPVPVRPPTDDLLAAMRSQRDALLAACDWTQMPDSPLTADVKAAWATYRQALRDLPEKTGDPANPVWPSEPGAQSGDASVATAVTKAMAG